MPRPAGTIYIRLKDIEALSMKEVRRIYRVLGSILFYPSSHRTKGNGRREKFGGSRAYGTHVPGLDNKLVDLYFALSARIEGDFDAV